MTQSASPLSLALASHSRLISATALRLAACAVVTLLLQSGASAACTGGWDVSGVWALKQTNDYVVDLNFQQAGNQLSGTASFRRTGDGAPSPVNLKGSLDGNLISFTVPWSFPGNPVGVYKGSINDQGKIAGMTHDKAHPGAEGSVAQWQGNRAAKCKVASTEPPIELGKVKKLPPKIPGIEDQVAEIPRKGGGAADIILQDAIQRADLIVMGVKGPGTLQAGLSGTYTVMIQNKGTAGAPVELVIIFAGKLDQTGQIVAGAGLACNVGHDAGINAALRCTGGRLAGGETANVVVQGRGQEAGAGKLVATLNPSRSVTESSYDNNLQQLNMTIN